MDVPELAAPWSAAQNAELVARGERFGMGESLVQTLLKKFGPLLGRLILDWIGQKLNEDSAFLRDHASEHLGTPLTPGVKLEFGGDFIKQFLLTMLRQHKEEVMAFICAQLDMLYDKAIDALLT